MVEDMKQAAAQCIAEVVVIRVDLGDLCAKIFTPAE